MDKLINQDNKQYRFQPGRNGSLTNVSKSQGQQNLINTRNVSKVIPMLKSMRKNRQMAETAAARG